MIKYTSSTKGCIFMFGEKPIYGQCVVHPDIKGRTCIPSFTGVEPTDELLVMRDIDGIRIGLAKEVDEYVALLEDMCKKELDPAKNDLIRKRLFAIYSNILKYGTCDKQNRMLLSNVLDPNKEYLVTGCRTSILIREKNQDEKSLSVAKRAAKPTV